MSADKEPQQIVAGDSLSWTRSFTDYPASAGWVLAYALRNYQQKIDFSATASGDSFAIAVPAATTAAWAPGSYEWIAFVTKAAERYTVASGEIDITPNLAIDSPVDGRSHNRKVYDNICAALEGRTDVDEYTIGGRSLRKMSIKDLLSWKSVYGTLVSREESGNSGGLTTYGARFSDAQ